ncbi:DNA alkylation repair protein [Aquincola sp. S2]|uniref:DNA alkylation repair protein n=1 Tax=Pseudaquabacterium terrae TaxID=2732868 RepID=A0ABX2EC84_9BURK|nr:DNA alkylation repair protein [Aquabacterium terrae]
MAALQAAASESHRQGLTRFAIPIEHAIGVPMAAIQAIAKRWARSHALAEQLWRHGGYESRMLAAYVDDPAQVTVAQMDRWCADFDNWAICDTLCFALFDRTPHAWDRLQAWAARDEEYVRRAAFALAWGLSVHDKQAPDRLFLDALKRIEQAAGDERHFVKKAVNMALRGIGKRNPALHAAAVALAARLAESSNPATRWIGKDAARELASQSVVERVSRARGSAPSPRPAPSPSRR